MLNNFKTRIASTALAMSIAAGAFVVAPTTALATTKNIKVVTNEETGENELKYDVQEGDTVSQISVFLVNRFWRNGEIPQEDIEMFESDPNTKCRFWPGVVYYYVLAKNTELAEQGKNKKVTKLRLRPNGEDIPVPSSYEELKLYTALAKKTGFHAAYCQQNHIYQKQQIIYIDREDAIRKIKEVFRICSPDREIYVDDNMLNTYLRMIGGADAKFVLKKGSKLKKDENWRFFELVLTPEEVEEEMSKPKTKVRK